MTVVELTDRERLDWLEEDVSRCDSVRASLSDTDLTLREIIDYLANLDETYGCRARGLKEWHPLWGPTSGVKASGIGRAGDVFAKSEAPPK